MGNTIFQNVKFSCFLKLFSETDDAFLNVFNVCVDVLETHHYADFRDNLLQRKIMITHYNYFPSKTAHKIT